MRINKKNALRLWEMCFGDNNFAEDFHGYLMCREGYGDPDYYVCDADGIFIIYFQRHAEELMQLVI